MTAVFLALEAGARFPGGNPVENALVAGDAARFRALNWPIEKSPAHWPARFRCWPVSCSEWCWLRRTSGSSSTKCSESQSAFGVFIVAILQFILFLHLTAFLSLILKRGALPLAIAIQYLGGSFLTTFIGLIFSFGGGGGSSGAIILLLIMICVVTTVNFAFRHRLAPRPRRRRGMNCGAKNGGSHDCVQCPDRLVRNQILSEQSAKESNNGLTHLPGRQYHPAHEKSTVSYRQFDGLGCGFGCTTFRARLASPGSPFHQCPSRSASSTCCCVERRSGGSAPGRTTRRAGPRTRSRNPRRRPEHAARPAGQADQMEVHRHPRCPPERCHPFPLLGQRPHHLPLQRQVGNLRHRLHGQRPGGGRLAESGHQPARLGPASWRRRRRGA